MNARTLPEKGEERQALLREVRYRLSYRGTLELDTLCRRLLPKLEKLDAENLAAIRDFLLEGENDLMAWLVEDEPAPVKYEPMIKLFKLK